MEESTMEDRKRNEKNKRPQIWLCDCEL